MMIANLVFGWRSAMLGVAAVQMPIVAFAHGRVTANRVANRCLAGQPIVLTGAPTPDIIGFAGFYDSFPWLSFAPFACPLAVAPLLYLYAVALTAGRLPIAQRGICCWAGSSWRIRRSVSACH
jgi:hypothetical protein